MLLPNQDFSVKDAYLISCGSATDQRKILTSLESKTQALTVPPSTTTAQAPHCSCPQPSTVSFSVNSSRHEKQRRIRHCGDLTGFAIHPQRQVHKAIFRISKPLLRSRR